MVRNSQNSLESSSEMAVQVSVQLEMTHILSNTNNMSLVTSVHLWFFICCNLILYALVGVLLQRGA